MARSVKGPGDAGLRSMLITFYGLSALIQGLVIARLIPVAWVNGGRSSSYASQAVQSFVSLVVLATLYVVIARGRASRMAVYALTGLWSVGTLLQILGTPFERWVLSPLLLLGVVAHVRLAKAISAS